MYQQLILDLIKVFNENAYLSVVLTESLEHLDLSDHDKKLYTLIFYSVVEKKLLIDYSLSPYTKGKRIKPYLKNALRIGAYVIDNLNVANHYIANELVNTVKKIDYKGSKLVNAILRAYINKVPIDLSKLPKYDQLSIKLSLPKELTILLYRQYGDKIVDFYKESSSKNSYRINTLKTNAEEIKNILTSLNISYTLKEDMIFTYASLINHDIFKNGLIIAQDNSSARVVKILNPLPNKRVLDVCAAPGGKSLYAATLMENQGYILSCDIYQNKLDKIAFNASKLGISIIHPLIADATNFDYQQLFDYVICDVPCSGLGVINHKPDLKYRMTLSDINDLIKLGRCILDNAKKYVKDDGILLYSTCTINKDENEYQIEKFLEENNEFEKIFEEIILPSKENDGFYICKLRRKKLEKKHF